MTVDIYDDLEHLVPAERRDAFLRLSRQIREYGDHNPELLRLVEVMGFLSLYTNDLPKRIAVEIDRGLATSQMANTACADMRAATTQLYTQLTTLQDTVDSAKAVAEHFAPPTQTKSKPPVKVTLRRRKPSPAPPVPSAGASPPSDAGIFWLSPGWDSCISSAARGLSGMIIVLSRRPFTNR
jgi:hypothetical protein